MKTKSLFYILTIMMLFIACDNDAEFEENREPSTEKDLKSGNSGLYIGLDAIVGNKISMYYNIPVFYESFSLMELQFKKNSEWVYYNPNTEEGSTNPYTFLHFNPLQIEGKYLPKGHPTLRFRVKDPNPLYPYSPTESGWSAEYTIRSENEYGFTPPPNFEGTNSTAPIAINLIGFMEPEYSNAYYINITVKINNKSKTYTQRAIGYFYATIGVQRNQVYTVNYTIQYTDSDKIPIGQPSKYSISVYTDRDTTIYID
jgi:hypothetical protein